VQRLEIEVMSMTRVMAIAGILLFATLVSGRSPDAALPRRPWLGVALGPHERGALVTGVVDGSSAAANGIRTGDVISAVDGVAVRVPQDVITAIGRHAGGETASVEIVRDGKPQTRMLTLREFPHETLPGVTFEYGAVTLTDGSRLRTIVSVPDRRDARSPAVMLIQGGGCGSVDVPMAPDVGPTSLLRTIAAQGFITIRVEKSGLGDSRGPACDAIGYAQELEGYRAALAALKRHQSVNTEEVFLLGVSLGGVFAPTLASAVRGIAVYGTLSVPPSPYPGRSERFFREISSVDVVGAWSTVSARVLAIRGQFDESAREADHAQIAATVNARHPGAASHVELAGLDHCWTRHDSMEKSRGHCGEGTEVSTLSDTVLAFLRSALLK
jgi:dienelactone hydrolase